MTSPSISPITVAAATYAILEPARLPNAMNMMAATRNAGTSATAYVTHAPKLLTAVQVNQKRSMRVRVTACCRSLGVPLLRPDQLRHPHPGQRVIQQRPMPQGHPSAPAPQRHHILAAQ